MDVPELKILGRIFKTFRAGDIPDCHREAPFPQPYPGPTTDLGIWKPLCIHLSYAPATTEVFIYFENLYDVTHKL